MQKVRESLKSLSLQHASSKSIMDIIAQLEAQLTQKAQTLEELVLYTDTLAEPGSSGSSLGLSGAGETPAHFPLAAKSLTSCKGKARRLSRQLEPAAARRIAEGRLACATPEKLKQGPGPRGVISINMLKSDSLNLNSNPHPSLCRPNPESPTRAETKPAPKSEPKSSLETDTSHPGMLVRRPSFHSRRSQEEEVETQMGMSPTLNRRKPFDKTTLEEKMDRLFANLQKPLKRHGSFEHELMVGYEFARDDRRDQSCTLDYASGCTACKPAKPPRGKSAEIRERAKLHDFSIPIAPTPK